MGLIIEIARFDCHPNWDIDRVRKFCNANGNLFFIWPVIPAVSIRYRNNPGGFYQVRYIAWNLILSFPEFYDNLVLSLIIHEMNRHILLINPVNHH